jgi:large subunit ribosomal protein L15
MPIYRRLPKRGFKNPTRPDYVIVNVGRVQAAIEAGKLDAGSTIDAAALITAGVIRRAQDGVRLLGKGEIGSAVTIEVAGASASARQLIEQAGGKVVVLGGGEPAAA